MSSSMVPCYSAPASPEPIVGCGAGPDVYFEGPEKKLEVFFTDPPHAAGFRHFAPSVWSDVLADAHCSILHSVGNDHFDAYLLSESSLFVYPHKLILKTCGTTTLLLVLPKVLGLASQLGCALSHVHYSHFRFAHPQLQLYPHRSFAQEQSAVASLLEGHISPVHAKVVLGGGGEEVGVAADDERAAAATFAPSAAERGDSPAPAEATRWYALCADGASNLSSSVTSSMPPPPAAPTPSAPPLGSMRGVGETAVLEVAMEGLAPGVCSVFVGGTHAPLEGRALASAMSNASGIRDLVPHASLDDWAFEPCGYSMNALAGPYYYTVHVTPELGFSYASFETNDPAYTSDESLAKILAVFQPSEATVTLTSHATLYAGASAATPPTPARVSPPAATYAVAAGWETSHLSAHVSVSAASFVRRTEGVTEGVGVASGKADAASAYSSTEVGSSTASLMLLDSDSASNSADSDSTARLDDVEETGSAAADGEASVVVEDVAVLPTGNELELSR